MGFFAKLRESASNIFHDMETALTRVTDKPTLIRVCYAGYLIGAADGSFSDEEKVALGKVINRKLPGFKNSEIMKYVDQATEACQLSKQAGKLELREEISKAANTPAARTIMLATLAIANADDNFDDDEVKVAKELCGWLGLNPREYEL